jgi:hypothetical protein
MLTTILLLAVILAASEHMITVRLARHYPWARLSKPTAYVVGVASFGALCFIRAWMNGQLVAFWDFSIIVAAFGVTVLALSAIDPEQPDSWEGVAERELTTDARAAVDMARILHGAAVDAFSEGIASLTTSDEYLEFLQRYRKGEGARLPRKQARRHVAREVGKDKQP